uniref:Uncharacterized protein n=1 Tax=Anopheles quadriannulatus TaxID=34691 RepID=A0A182XLT6_ANOQN
MQLKEHSSNNAARLQWRSFQERLFASVIARNLSLSSIIDPGTSDDSGRASERLTTSSVAQRDPDSSRDRLSDASSRCSSGKGYICDSEGDDDKVSQLQRTTTPSVSKHVLPSQAESGLVEAVDGSR